MDEQMNGLPEQPEVKPVEVIEGAGFVMHSVPEAESSAPVNEDSADQEGKTAPEVQEEPVRQETQSQWQGGYSYQNPNPYQNYGVPSYQYQVPKKKNTGLIIAVVVSACVMALCCALIVFAQLVGFDGFDITENETIQELPQKNDKTDEKAPANDAQRDDEVVYNMPDISKEEKHGEKLSIVDVNKKMKNSVVAILVAFEKDEDVQFSGSGFVVSKDGYIFTNAHVIEDAKKVEVVLIDGITSYNATIVGQDERADLAILKVDATGLSPAELGDSDQLEEGEDVVCIGNPYGMELSGSITNGIVSALNRKIEMNGGYMTLIQTNAEINPGNSGGPLINAYGQVVGITSSKLVASGYEGIGFAIPINDAIELSEELINYGYVKSRGYIGFSGNDLTEAYAKYHDLPQGVYVVFVNEGSDAEKKGLKKDDIVIGFNGQEIKSMAELNDLKDQFRPGDTVTIKVWRDGDTFDLEIRLTDASN